MTWCVVANVRPEAYGDASATGTKHFRAGALLWVVTAYWGTGFERVHVIGRHRVSKRLIAVVEEGKRLTSFRAKEAHHPAVLAALRAHAQPIAWPTREDCERAARGLDVTYPPVPDLPGEIERRKAALRMLEHEERGRALEAQAAAALGRWSPAQRQADRVPPYEVFVLSDWLEERGVPIALPELVRTLDRRRGL